MMCVCAVIIQGAFRAQKRADKTPKTAAA